MSEREPKDQRAYLTALCRTVPYHIVEAVLADPTERSVRSEAFDATVVFADLVGFTPMCERLAAGGSDGLSQLGEILSTLFESLLERALFPYGGYVVHFGGDSCTTFFRGADHALRGAAAALTAQRLMHGEVGRLLQGKSRDLMLRIGLASGETRLPILGDLSQRGVVCAGPTAHRALEMQGLAAPGSVVADSSTLAALGGLAEVVDRHADRATLRGLHRWPPSRVVDELGDRIDADLEAKIALLEPFVPGPLAGRLMTMPKHWSFEGELRPAVVAFAELWGLDEGTPDVEVARNVSRSLLRAFRKYGGVLAKADLALRGHRLMILFGLHRPAENDGERTVLASLEAAARLKAFTVANGLPISIRIGVHGGLVYYGAIGSAHKHDITVVGDTVNVAARAAAAAEPFEVMVTDTVMRPLGREFESTSHGPMVVKGKSAPIELHRVHGAAGGSAHYLSTRRAPRFCAGRTVERDFLWQAVDEALAGRARMIGLCGARGTGKSALLAEVIDRWTGRGAVGIIGRCRFAANAVPLAPVMNMFATFLGIAGGDSEEERRERIRTGLRPLGLQRGAPELVALLQPVERPDGSSEALLDLANSESREAVLGSIIEFIERRLEQEPVLYVLEDLHLADSLTLELASRLSRLPPHLPALFITTYRPHPVLNEFRRALANELELGNLPIGGVEELVRNELKVARVDPDLLVFLWQRTGGNPGHVVEIVRFLTERSLLRSRGGLVSPQDGGVEQLEELVPASLTHVTLARLDELGAVERRLLRMASAIGRRFGRSLLTDAAQPDFEPDALEAAIAALEGGGVIVPSAHEPSGYMFSDGVIRAVTYGTIPEPERRAIHRQIANAMERLLPVGEGPQAAQLGRHRERAGQLKEAARWYERAARGAMRQGLVAEAADLADRWQRVVAGLAEAERPEPSRRARMAMLRFVAAARIGDPAATLRLGRVLLAEHRAELNRAARITVDLKLGETLVALGRPDKARVRLERVLAHGEAADQQEAARTLAVIHRQARELDQAAHWLERAAAGGNDSPNRRVRLEIMRGELLAAGGDLERAVPLLERAREAARGVRRTTLVGAAGLTLGYAWLWGERFAEAEAAFDEASGAYRSAGYARNEARALRALGEVFLWSGRVDAARPLLEQALAIAQHLGDELGAAAASVQLGAALAWTQDPAAGAAMLEEACRQTITMGLRDFEVMAELHLLRTALLRGDRDGAAVALRRCVAHQHHLVLPLWSNRFTALRAEAARLAGDA